MADGNFNTKILPPGGFASGVRAGEARMKQRALKVMKETLETHLQVSDEVIDALLRTFKVRLDETTT